jgi:hypothetical protein
MRARVCAQDTSITYIPVMTRHAQFGETKMQIPLTSPVPQPDDRQWRRSDRHRDGHGDLCDDLDIRAARDGSVPARPRRKKRERSELRGSVPNSRNCLASAKLQLLQHALNSKGGACPKRLPGCTLWTARCLTQREFFRRCIFENGIPYGTGTSSRIIPFFLGVVTKMVGGETLPHRLSKRRTERGESRWPGQSSNPPTISAGRRCIASPSACLTKDIAAGLRIDEKTLAKHFASELLHGRTIIRQELLAAVTSEAIKGRKSAVRLLERMTRDRPRRTGRSN